MDTDLKDAPRIELETAIEGIQRLAEHAPDPSIFDAAIEGYRSVLADLARPRGNMVTRYGRTHHPALVGTLTERRRDARRRAFSAVVTSLRGGDTDAAVECLAVAWALHPENNSPEAWSDAREIIDRDRPRGEGTTFARWRDALTTARALEPCDADRPGPYATAIAIAEQMTDWSAETIRSDTRSTTRTRRQV